MAKKRQRTNNELQNTTQKIKDRATRTLLKTEDELRCCGRLNNSCSISGSRRVTLVTNPVMIHIMPSFMLILGEFVDCAFIALYLK